MEQRVEKSIKNNPDYYILFYSERCGYSIRALELLRSSKVKYKAYDIEKKFDSLDHLLGLLNLIKDINFNINHQTRPVIFYRGKFIGGYTELVAFINKK